MMGHISTPPRDAGRVNRAGRSAARGFRARLLLALVVLSAPAPAGHGLAVSAQGGSITLFGDVKVDESKAEGRRPMSFGIILYTIGGNVVGRQNVSSGGRYRFINLRGGEYDIAVEVENSEIARVRVMVAGVAGSDFRQDLEFAWKPGAAGAKRGG
ncbi:MAG: hypothetical protein ACRD68_14710, partial [Pyrinomonadaceae bacterium]